MRRTNSNSRKIFSENQTKILKAINKLFLIGKDIIAKTISEETGIGIDTIRKHTKVLVDSGVIKEKEIHYIPSENPVFPFKEIEIAFKFLKRKKDSFYFLEALPDEMVIKRVIIDIGEMIKRGIIVKDIICFIAGQKYETKIKNAKEL